MGVANLQLARQRASVQPRQEIEVEPASIVKEAYSSRGYISLLRNRTYLDGEGMPRNNWIVLYGSAWSEAWDRAYERACQLAPSSAWDYELERVREHLKSSKMTASLGQVKNEVRAVVEERLRGFAGLPPDTRRRAIGDAVIFATLLEVGNPAGGRYDHMLGLDEVWKSGLGRFTTIDGKIIAYGVRESADDIENIIRI